MYGETKKDLVAIIKKLCEMKQVDLIDGRVCKDHIHMYVAIPPKISCRATLSGRLKQHFIIADFSRKKAQPHLNDTVMHLSLHSLSSMPGY